MEKLNASTVYYFVKDMDRAIKFYTEVLNLPLKVRYDDHWAEVDAGTITIGLHPTEAGKEAKDGGGGTVSFIVNDIDSIVSELRKKGVKVGEIHQPERGKFTIITDPDGNNIHFIEFSKNWLKETGTEDHLK